jgi:hypothetical protein
MYTGMVFYMRLSGWCGSGNPHPVVFSVGSQMSKNRVAPSCFLSWEVAAGAGYDMAVGAPSEKENSNQVQMIQSSISKHHTTRLRSSVFVPGNDSESSTDSIASFLVGMVSLLLACSANKNSRPKCDGCDYSN